MDAARDASQGGEGRTGIFWLEWIGNGVHGRPILPSVEVEIIYRPCVSLLWNQMSVVEWRVTDGSIAGKGVLARLTGIASKN